MRLRKQKLTTMLVLMFAAALALPAVNTFRPGTVRAGAQDQSRSDVKAPAKSTPVPKGPSGAAPANDNCANAILIADCPFTDTQDTTGATDETNEPASTCTSQGSSVWYTGVTGDNFVNVTVDTCGSNFDTAIMVWQVDPAQPCNFASFVPVACNDDGACGGGLLSSVSLLAQPNSTYKIQVGGFDGDTGNLVVNVTCEELACDPVVINGTLGSGDPNFPGPQFSGNALGRLNRNGVSSTCAAPKTCLIFTNTGLRAFDAYSIPNESGEDACVSVNLAEPGGTCNLQSNAYLGTFDPNNICTNYLADPGLSTGVPPTPTNMSFVVPAGQTLTVVVMTTNPGETGCAYTVTITGDLCQQFDYCVQDDRVPGRFILINSTTGEYEYHDCAKGIVLSGTGVVSTYFCKIQLFDSGPVPKRPDRSISVLINPCTMRGDASIKGPGIPITVTLGDADITNNNCECPM